MERNELANQLNLACQERSVLPWGEPCIVLNRRKISTRQDLLDEIAIQILPILPTDFDMFLGIPYGGIKITENLIRISQKEGTILKKNSDNNLFFENMNFDIKNKKIILVDDTVCRGRRSLEAEKIIKKNGGQVLGVSCIFSEGQETIKKLEERNIKFFPLFTSKELYSHL